MTTPKHLVLAISDVPVDDVIAVDVSGNDIALCRLMENFMLERPM